MSFRQLFLLELKEIVKDSRRAVFLFGASIVYLLLFGSLYGTHVITNVPTVICDEDNTQLSRLFIQALTDSERLKIVALVSSQEEMQDYIHEKRALAAINIPSGFSKEVKTGVGSSVLTIINGTNLVVTNTVSTAVQEIGTAFSSQLAIKSAELYGQMPQQAQNKIAPINLRFNVLNNSTLSYFDFFIIGLAMAAFQQGIFLAVGAGIYAEREQPGKLTGMHIAKAVAGKLLPYMICAAISFFATLGVALLTFGLSIKGNLGSLLLLSLVFTFAATALAAAAATLVEDYVWYLKYSLVYSVPGFILSGHIWPRESMDMFSQLMSYFLPYTYFADTVRDIIIAGYTPHLYSNLLTLLVIGTVCLSVFAYNLPRKLA